MDYYNEIKNRLIDNEIYARVKEYSKESYKVNTYFEIGRLLTEAGGKYGDNIIDEYSIKLMDDVGKKYNKRTLFRMKQFYNTFAGEKVSTLSTQLSWSHYTELLPIKDKNEMLYYFNLCIKQNINVRGLRERIKSKEYNRLSLTARNRLINNNHVGVKDLIPNPILIKSKNKSDDISEKVLHRIIMEDIELFMRELGNSFCFVGSEYKIKIGDRYNYIDLLLFNIEYNCYVVIELKTTELKKEHIGQIQVYMNYIDDNIRKFNHDETIGIIICKQNNSYVIKYCSDDRIISRIYELV